MEIDDLSSNMEAVAKAKVDTFIQYVQYQGYRLECPDN